MSGTLRMRAGRILPESHGSLARGVASSASGTIFTLTLAGGIALGSGEGRTVVFGRNRPDVHVCLGEDDLRVSRRQGTLVHLARKWWVHNHGRVPIRLPNSRLLFENEDPVPLDEGYTPLFVRGSKDREHLLEVYVTGADGRRPAPRHRDITLPPRIWALDEDERLALVVLGQRYLLHEPRPQPLPWHVAAAQLAELAPEAGWTRKRVEHLVVGVRNRLSADGVAGLTRAEIGEPVGNALNHNLLRELLLSTTLVPPDLAVLDGDRRGVDEIGRPDTLSLVRPFVPRQDRGVDLPLTEFDPNDKALITPTPPALTEPLPERVVMCFFPEVVDDLVAAHGGRHIGEFSREIGGHRIYRLVHDGIPVAVFHPGIGAPLAVQHLERAIAAGGRAFVACGGAGAVQPGLALGHVVVPDAALRDEGTSYHYAPPARVIRADPSLVDTAVATLVARGVPYTTGMTWTTDGVFRETPARVRARRDEGCVTVEMETAAFLAVAAFRGVRFVQYLYAGDDVSGEAWDHRGWTTADVRADLFRLAVETATAI